MPRVNIRNYYILYALCYANALLFHRKDYFLKEKLMLICYIHSLRRLMMYLYTFCSFLNFSLVNQSRVTILKVGQLTKGAKMDLRRLQLEQLKWANHNFPNRTPWQVLLGVMEELGELSHAHLKAEQGIRNIQPGAKGDAVADIIIYLVDYCTQERIDIADELSTAWATVSRRDWVQFPENGISK